MFNGKVIVAEGAQQTDSNQSNKNLLLSLESNAFSNPQLEIYADEMYHVDMDQQQVLWMKIAFFTYAPEVLIIQVLKKY